MMNMQAGMDDWDHHNWFAARRRTDSEGFHFLVWDAEKGLTPSNRVIGIVKGGLVDRPTGVFSDLLKNNQFKDLFISHVNRHFFEGGALCPDPCLARYENWLDEIDTALIADQARWVMEVDDIWNKSFHAFIYDYFPPRTETVFNQFVDNGLYPSIETPEFNADNNSTIPKDFQLYMSAPSGSHIRYTTDGTDPGHFKFSEKNSISIYNSESLPLPSPGETLEISARVKKDSLWSVLVTRRFVIGDFLSDFADEISQENELLIYPNPATELFNIRFSNPEQADYQLIITDLRGKVMRIIDPISGNFAEIPRDGLPGGLYLLELRGPDTHRGKILIE
jgi:hypothetical protein